MAEDETISWNVDLEVSLFHAMRRHKPVGVNRHFQMMIIQEKLNNSISKQRMSCKQIWKHLGVMYDLQALNESEIAPFPNKETDFFLPKADFGSHLSEDFPRAKEGPTTSTSDDVPSRETSTKADRDSRDSVTKPGRPSAVEKAAERLQEMSKYDDSPRREQRKRTRGTTQSPAPTPENTSTKRARRT